MLSLSLCLSVCLSLSVCCLSVSYGVPQLYSTLPHIVLPELYLTTSSYPARCLPSPNTTYSSSCAAAVQSDWLITWLDPSCPHIGISLRGVKGQVTPFYYTPPNFLYRRGVVFHRSCHWNWMVFEFSAASFKFPASSHGTVGSFKHPLNLHPANQ